MAIANVLASSQALEMGIYVVRAFVHLCHAGSVHADLVKQLVDLQHKTVLLAAQHDSFSHTTRTPLKQVFDALRQMIVPPDPPKRLIGFITSPDKPT